MIFHDLKTIFIHVERTGGVSVRKHLLEHENHFRRWQQTKHFTSSEMKELTQLWDIWDNYYKFAFVRNPYDRLVSWYNACHLHHEWVSDIALYMRQYNTLSELIYHNQPHSQLIKSQYETTSNLDFVGRFENREEDFGKICDKIDIPYSNRKENTSVHLDYKTYYTGVTKKIVTEWFKEDLERFKYEF